MLPEERARRQPTREARASINSPPLLQRLSSNLVDALARALRSLRSFPRLPKMSSMPARLPTLVSGLVVALGTAGCPRAIEPTADAKRANELCANYIAQGELERAEVQCDLGLEYSPDYADLWVNKGIIAFRREDTKRAKEHFIKALRINADQAQAYNNLGVIYLREKQLTKAIDAFRNALRVVPGYLEARLNLALTYREVDQPDKAKKELMTLIEINPSLAIPHAHLGQLYADGGALDEAIAELTRAVQLDPRFVEAYVLLGNVQVEAGKSCDAKDTFTACLEVDDKNAACRNNLPIATQGCQSQASSLEQVRRGEGRRGGPSPGAEYDAALAFRHKGQVEEEEQAFKRCLARDPRYAPCHFGLFELFRTRGEDRNAAIACKNFMKFANALESELQLDVCKKYLRE